MGHHHIRILAEQVHRHARVGGGVELDVGLVEQHEHVGGHGLHDAARIGVRDRRGGGVVRIVDDDQARAVVDRGDQTVHVMRAVRQVRHLHAGGAGAGHDQWVRLEATPRVDDLVARTGHQVHQHGDDLGGSAAEHDVLRLHAVALGQPFDHGPAAHVRVAVHAAGGLAGDGLDHAGQRFEGVLVAGQLERALAGLGRRRLALLVSGDGVKNAAMFETHNPILVPPPAAEAPRSRHESGATCVRGTGMRGTGRRKPHRVVLTMSDMTQAAGCTPRIWQWAPRIPPERPLQRLFGPTQPMMASRSREETIR